MRKDANTVQIAYRFSNTPKSEPATNVRDEEQLRTLFKYAKQFLNVPMKHGKPFHVKLVDVTPNTDERRPGTSGKKVSIQFFFLFYILIIYNLARDF